MEMESTGGTRELRRLAELLQERQEPFTLDSYLSQRGRGGRRSSANDGKKQETKKMYRFSRMLRALCDSAVVVRGKSRKKKPSRSGEGECSGICRNNCKAVGLESISSASGTRVYGSCSDSEPGGGSLQKSDEPREGEITQVDAERDIQMRCQDKNKQPSTVPVTARETSVEQFRDKPQHRVLQVFSAWQEVDDPTCRTGLPKRITEDSSSACTFEILSHCKQDRTEDSSSACTFEILSHCKQDRTGFVAQPTQPMGEKAYLDYLNSKRVLQKTKQLLFDCVKEVIESHGRQDRTGKYKNTVIETEEIGKIVYEKLVGWGRIRGNEKSIDQLVYLDYLETAEEWRECAHHRMQISMQIGDALMEDISNEIVAELICHY